MGTYEKTMLKLEKMAQKNTAQGQKWQTDMSNTAHQREVKDLVAAGLNPVLSSGGSGAPSYTTSVDSAVNGIAGMASAREGANATRYAARQSAMATRAAAAAQIEAARISERASNYAVDHSKSGTIPGVLSNIMRDYSEKGSFKDYSFTKDRLKDINNNTEKYLFNADKGLSFSNFNFKGKQFLQSYLRRYGISVTMPNQQLAFNALVLQRRSSANTLAGLIAARRRSAYNARSRFSMRTGSGIW